MLTEDTLPSWVPSPKMPSHMQGLSREGTTPSELKARLEEEVLAQGKAVSWVSPPSLPHRWSRVKAHPGVSPHSCSQ